MFLPNYIITVSSKLNPKERGKSALLALIYCVVMNIIGAFVGLLTTYLIRPGKRFKTNMELNILHDFNKTRLEMTDVFSDFLR